MTLRRFHRIRTKAKQALGLAYGALSSADLTSRFEALCASGIVSKGRYSYGTPDVHVFRGNQSKLRIGSFCSIADRVTILLGGNHPGDWVSTFPFRAKLGLAGAFEDGMPSSNGDVVIGSDVWIGHGAVLLSGIEIGHGAIVGAGSLVARDIPPYAIAVGVPAKVVSFRFRPEQIEGLLATQWWGWPLDRIRNCIDLLSSPEVDRFLHAAGGSTRISPQSTTEE